MAVPHPTDIIKRTEHYAMEWMVNKDLYPKVFNRVRSGPWSDAAGWDQGSVPAGDCLVSIDGLSGQTIQVDIDDVFPDAVKALCVCPGGRLNVLPDRNTGVNIATTCICTDDTGLLPDPVVTLGTTDPRFTSIWTFADRGPRDYTIDPLDMSGGFCTHSKNGVIVAGAEKTPYAIPATEILHGSTSMTIQMISVPADWNDGDVLLFPGNNHGESETRTMLAHTATSITLDSGLTHNHYSGGKNLRKMGSLGIGLCPNVLGMAPIANLTLNTVFVSANPALNSARGHFMLMHVNAGSITNAAFIDLGRTNAMTVHTRPTLVSGEWVVDGPNPIVSGSDGNSMGLYGSVHAHVRSGPTWATKPIIMRHIVAWGKSGPLPKHADNNHGGYVNRSYMIRYNGQGFGGFSENGSEIGADRFNLSVGFVGVNTSFDSQDRDIACANAKIGADRGFMGGGHWLQSGGIEMTDCQAWDCREGIACLPVVQQFDMSPTLASWMLVANVNPPASANQERPYILDALALSEAAKSLTFYGGAGTVQPSLISPYIARCYTNGNYQNGDGFASYNVGAYPSLHPGLLMDVYSDHCLALGVMSEYSRNMTFKGGGIAAIDPSNSDYPGRLVPLNNVYLGSGAGMAGNGVTKNITLVDRSIEGHMTGWKVPYHGDNSATDCFFNNRLDIDVPAPWNGSLTLPGCTFGTYQSKPVIYPKLGNIILRGMDVKNDYQRRNDQGDDDVERHPFISYFEPFRMFIDGVEIFHAARLDSFVPFPTQLDTAVPSVLIGLTNAQMRQQFGIQIGGYQILDQTLAPHPLIFQGGGTGALGIGPVCTGVFPPGSVTPPVVAPVAAFSASPLSGTAPLTVQFMDQSTNKPSSWMWDFGDGATSTAQNPSHQYASAGTYSVTLRVMNSAGMGTVTKASLVAVTPQMAVITDIATGLNAAQAAAFSTATLTAKSAGFSATLPTHIYTQTPAAGSSAPVGSMIVVN